MNNTKIYLSEKMKIAGLRTNLHGLATCLILVNLQGSVLEHYADWTTNLRPGAESESTKPRSGVFWSTPDVVG